MDKVVGMVVVVVQLDMVECSAPKVDVDGAVDNIRIHTQIREIKTLTESIWSAFLNLLERMKDHTFSE